MTNVYGSAVGSGAGESAVAATVADLVVATVLGSGVSATAGGAGQNRSKIEGHRELPANHE